MASPGPALPSSKPTLQAVGTNAKAQPVAQVSQPAESAQPVTAEPPLQSAWPSFLAPVGSTEAGVSPQFQALPDSIAVTSTQNAVSGDALPGNLSPADLSRVDLSEANPSSLAPLGSTGVAMSPQFQTLDSIDVTSAQKAASGNALPVNPSSADVSRTDLSATYSPSTDAASVASGENVPAVATAPVQGSSEVIPTQILPTEILPSQIPQNSALPLATLPDASPEASPNDVQRNRDRLPIAFGMDNRGAEPTTPVAQPPLSQKSQAGATSATADNGADLAFAVQSAVAHSMAEFSNGKVVAPNITPAQSSHGAASTNTSNPFATTASTSENQDTTNTASTATKNTASDATSATSASAAPPSTHSNRDAQSAGSGNSPSDGQHKGPTATEAVAGVAQAPASVQIAVAAPEPASESGSTHTLPSAPLPSPSGGPNPTDSPSVNVPLGNLAVGTGAMPVQAAQMVATAAQSEMRIGMSTPNFGSVEVRAVIHAGDVGVLIGSEKGDLRSLLAPELPGIANSLEQQNLRLAPVSFQQHGFAFSSHLSSGGDSQSRSYSSRPSPKALQPDSSTSEIELSPERSAAEAPMGRSATGLSILA